MKTHAAFAVTAAFLALASGCVPPAEDEMTETAESGTAAGSEDASSSRPEPVRGLAELLADGAVVFGIFAGPQSAEGGALMAERSGMDFVFYSLENGPFDLDTYGAYVDAMHEALGPEAPRRPTALRIPPIGDDPEGARDRASRALEAGADAIVVPHVRTADEAAIAAELVGGNAWPGRPDGVHVSILIVEDREGIANVSSIVGTPDVGVVFAGPGDLGRAYEGDAEAVEGAIQAVLAACLEHGVPCGITADADDIGERIEQGFRVFIVQDTSAIVAGRAAAGR